MNPPGNEACHAASVKSGHPMRKEAVKSEYSVIGSAEINTVNHLYINKINFKTSIKNQYCGEKKERVNTLGAISTLPLLSQVVLGKLFKLSVSWFPHL